MAGGPPTLRPHAAKSGAPIRSVTRRGSTSRRRAEVLPGGWPQITAAGDAGVLVRFGDEVNEAIFERVFTVLGRLESLVSADHEAVHEAAIGRGEGQQVRPTARGRLTADERAAVLDIVPGYASLLLIFDPARLSPVRARALVQMALATASGGEAIAAAVPTSVPRTIEIPVLYHPDVAPDLVALAQDKGLSIDELVARHSQPLYRCHALGFRPGFPFLAGLMPELFTPRLATPRLSVAEGSVGIAGRQTGVYPSQGPGGWRLVGRTPLRLFDPTAAEPFLVHPGDRVRFVPIDRRQFEAAR